MRVTDEQISTTLGKLNTIFRTGFVPRRGLMPYFFAGHLANPFEHACFNLSDLQLIVNEFDIDDADVFSDFYTGEEGKLSARDRMVNFVRETGLKVVQSGFDCPLMKNSWRVALYFNDSLDLNKKNFQLMRLEEEGIWTGKKDWGEKIFAHKRAPEKLDDEYTLFDVIDISNPNYEM